MSFQTNLNELFASGNPYAVAIAEKIKNIDDAYANKLITADEAKDLLNDMKTEEALVDLANNLQIKLYVQQTIDKLIFLVENVIF
jgi:hypothetical protein